MALKRINDNEYADRLDYLLWTAGVDLHHTLQQAEDDNMAKVIETLHLIARSARECAVYLEAQQR